MKSIWPQKKKEKSYSRLRNSCVRAYVHTSMAQSVACKEFREIKEQCEWTDGEIKKWSSQRTLYSCVWSSPENKGNNWKDWNQSVVAGHMLRNGPSVQICIMLGKTFLGSNQHGGALHWARLSLKDTVKQRQEPGFQALTEDRGGPREAFRRGRNCRGEGLMNNNKWQRRDWTSWWDMVGMNKCDDRGWEEIVYHFLKVEFQIHM